MAKHVPEAHDLEDALQDGLVRVARDGGAESSRVSLTALGRAMLDTL